MSQRIDPFDYANHITHALHSGILLNTNGDKFNSMVIGWGHMGVVWNKNTFVVYVRESRYTHAQLGKTGLFTISSPWAERGEARLTPEIMRAFGSESGRDIDKADYVTLVKGQTIDVPAIAEYPSMVIVATAAPFMSDGLASGRSTLRIICILPAPMA